MKLMHATGFALLLTAHAAVSQPAPRDLPARLIPVPATVSPEMQAIIAQAYGPLWNVVPKSPADWKAIVDKAAAPILAGLPALREQLGVAVQPTTIAGVKAFIVTPKEIPPANRDRVLVHVHGGYYVLAPGEAGTREAILLAGFGGFKVISVDYRMPPDFPYPAALDDAMAVYRAVLRHDAVAECRHFRHLGRRRADAGDGAACKAGAPAAALAPSRRARRGRT